MKSRIRVCGGAIVALMLLCAPVWVAAQEFEPNNTCETAQVEPVPGFPLVRKGELTASGDTLDVDFYRFEATPGMAIEVNVEGAPSGGGTLDNPFVGWFDARCNLIAYDDDGGDALNAQLVVFVPNDGVFTVGVSRCCDYNFEGNGRGSYRLTLKKRRPIGGIYGEVVNAETGARLSGFLEPWLVAELFSCRGQSCQDPVANMSADETGAFLFTQDRFGLPLLNGNYQVQLYAQGYDPLRTETFTAPGGSISDLGKLRMTPMAFVGLIEGQLLDDIDGTPLTGDSPLFSNVLISACQDSWCSPVSHGEVDRAGRFRIDGVYGGLQPGTYVVTAYADGYEPAQSEEFTLAREENVDLGELRLTPFPLRVNFIRVCDLVAGKTCRFGIKITAHTAEPLLVEAWSMIEFVNPSAPVYNSRFQIGRNGLADPRPQSLTLAPGKTRELVFQFQMPRDLDQDSVLCANILIGQMPKARFNPLIDQWVFCVQPRNGQLTRLSTEEALDILRTARPD